LIQQLFMQHLVKCSLRLHLPFQLPLLLHHPLSAQLLVHLLLLQLLLLLF
jgi:hypothetical protein